MTEQEDRAKQVSRTASLRYYHANRERLLTANKAYREANRETLAQKERERRLARVEAERAADPEYDAKRLAKRRAQRADSAESRREYSRRYYLANRARILADSKAAYLKRTYGITPEQHAQMLAEKDSTCWICGGPGGSRELSVDHCHKTGKPRGILCFHCNTSIGKLGDDAAGLRRALAYLEAFEETSSNTDAA